MMRASLTCALLARGPLPALARRDAVCDAGAAGSVKSGSLLQTQGSRFKGAGKLLEDDESDDRVPSALDSSHFSGGTLRIRASGTYTLTEDIEFLPATQGMSWSRIPPDSSMYPQEAGYFLGFFAAIAIEADNVQLDCKGHEIKMSSQFHKLQRFFSIIELGSAPFLRGQGPPPFASSLSTPAAPVNPKGTVIKNCKLGLSSHHSIHGNDNVGVTLESVKMYDFEVAGVALNGASNVVMKNLQIGPSLKKTFRAGLSQAIFLDHLGNTLMDKFPAAAAKKRATGLMLRGEPKTAEAVLSELRGQLKQYLTDGTGPLKEVAGSGSDLPDGSAVYGVLLHRSGVAVNRLGFCPDDSRIASKRVSNIRLHNIAIKDLSVKVDQVTRMIVDGKTVAGPAGDVFQPTKTWDSENCFRYVGNALSDAQLAMGKVCAALAGGISEAEHAFYCGGAHVPASVQAWASGSWSCSATRTWAEALQQGGPAMGLFCDGDAMNHFNKGAVGMRLGFQEDISVRGVTIDGISNSGVANATPWCKVTDEPYQGLDVRAASLAHMMDVHDMEITHTGLKSSDSSRIFPVTTLADMRADDPKVSH